MFHDFLRLLWTVDPEFVVLSVGILMFLNAAVQLPPSEYVAITAGVYLAGNLGTSVAALLVATSANLLGTTIWYVVGRLHSRRGEFIGLTRSRRPGLSGRIYELYTSRLGQIEQAYLRHGAVIVFALRNVPVIRSICSYPAGRVRMPLPRFLFASFLGILLWVSLWMGLGLGLGKLALDYQWYVSLGVGALSLAALRFAFHHMDRHVLPTSQQSES